jgi:hypothetical protein
MNRTKWRAWLMMQFCGTRNHQVLFYFSHRIVGGAPNPVIELGAKL